MQRGDYVPLYNENSALENEIAGHRIKRAIDILGVLVAFILFSIPMLVIAITLKIQNGRVFFGHKRVGYNGETFTCWKFQTMVPNAQEVLEEILANDPEAKKEWELYYKLKNDPRVTKFGNFLRKTSLDELPQFFNVLVGEMSLVGPRPVVRDELKYYGKKTGFYLMAKPGITGLWQISGRSNTVFSERVLLDTEYARNWSILRDIAILLQTVPAFLFRRGAC